MQIDLPNQKDDTSRHFYSNDGTPVIIDYDQDEDPVGAYHLTTQDGGFIWRTLNPENDDDQKFFMQTIKFGHEVELEEFESRVVRDFVDLRSARFNAGGLDA